MLRAIVVIVSGLLLAGCASKYRIDSFQAPSARLSSQSAVYVVLPKDGSYGVEQYRGSGAMTASAAVTALARHIDKVEQAQTPEDTTQALASAKQHGFTHVFEPTILHWEDRATEWSGIPDKITIKFNVYDVQTGQSVASTITRASSKWGTLGGDHPQDLLPIPTQQFVDHLF
jgi:hypothetical protein